MLGVERLAGFLVQYPSLTHLNLSDNGIFNSGTERLAGVLGQCQALAHLDLGGNQIRDAGAERLEGVLVQCTALVHLDLSYNHIGAAGKGRLRASWCGQASALLLLPSTPSRAKITTGLGELSPRSMLGPPTLGNCGRHTPEKVGRLCLWQSKRLNILYVLLRFSS
jgi:Leucine-rich repeat (LRR) protein